MSSRDAGLIERHPKPGWSPEHMSALMYTCHLGVYRRALAVDLGGFQSRFDGCQDYDFVLRLMERTDRIAHIPRILYHWRAHAMSTAGGTRPSRRRTWPSRARSPTIWSAPGSTPKSSLRICPGFIASSIGSTRRRGVDIVLAIHDQHGLAEAAVTWLAQPHLTWSVVLAAAVPRSRTPQSPRSSSAGIHGTGITIVPTEPRRSRRRPARRRRAATAEHLLLMQAPAAGLTHDWLTRLIGYSNQPQIAAAGPVLLAPDGRIQQAGIAIPEGIPLHLQYGSAPQPRRPWSTTSAR